MNDLIPYLAPAALLVVVVYLWTPPHPNTRPFDAQSLTGRVRYVVDGDTLQIASHSPRVRLWGINTPEKNEYGFQAATNQLKRLVHGQKIRCQIMSRDKYGRTVARCYLADGRDVGALMIQSGHAKEMHGFSRGYYSKR